jgi:hypothetical protein
MKVRHICTIIAMLALFAACGQAQSATPAAPAANTAAPASTQGLVGTWTTTVTKDDLLRVVPDFKREYLCDNAGAFVWQFKPDGTFTIDQRALEGCPAPASAHSESTWSSQGNLVTFAKGAADQEEYAWSIASDVLIFKHRSGNCIPCKATNTANPWKRLKN